MGETPAATLMDETPLHFENLHNLLWFSRAVLTLFLSSSTLDASKMSLIGNLLVAAMFTEAGMLGVSPHEESSADSEFRYHQFGCAIVHGSSCLKAAKLAILWLVTLSSTSSSGLPCGWLVISHVGEVWQQGGEVRWYGGGSSSTRQTWQCNAWVAGRKVETGEERENVGKGALYTRFYV